MTGNVLFWVYLLGCAAFLVPTAKFVFHLDDDGLVSNREDLVGAVLIAFCAVWAWPLYLPGWLAYRAIRGEAETLK